MMAEEKEINIDEIRRLVDLSAVLPELLNKISEIHKEINNLHLKFNALSKQFEATATAVDNHKNSVDKVIKDQIDIKDIEKLINDLKEELYKKIDALSPQKDEKKEETKSKAKSKKELEKEAEEKKEKDDIDRIVDAILGADKGRRKRRLTLLNVKQGFKCDDEKAQKVLDRLTNLKFYDPKDQTLYFVKK